MDMVKLHYGSFPRKREAIIRGQISNLSPG